jgi:hypothetical protein
MPWQRDPVSTWFDGPARRLIARAYLVKGEWAGVYVAPPGPAQWAQLGLLGINPFEKDRWGEVRWIRGFKRAVFHELNWYGGVTELRPVPNTGAGTHGWHAPVRGQWETGALVRKAGWPTRRRAVRFRIHSGGARTSEIGKQARDRWVDDDGHPTFRQSVAADPNGWTENR